MPRRLAFRVLPFMVALLFPAPALAVKREIIKELQTEFAGRIYQLRIDLRGTDYFAAFNVVNEHGVHYRGRQLAVIFYGMESVYLDRISNESEREIRLSVYRNRADAQQIRGSIPATPLPGIPDRDTALGAFARDLSTTVILELRAGKDEPALQREQIAALLERLFYLKESPTLEQKEAFILSHMDLPLPRLTSITGLGEDQVRGILMKGEARKQ